MLSSLSASLMMMTRMSLAIAKSILRMVSAAWTVLFFALSAARREVSSTRRETPGPKPSPMRATRVLRRAAAASALARSADRALRLAREAPEGAASASSTASSSSGATPSGWPSSASWRRPAITESASSPRPRRMSATRRSCVQAPSPDARSFPECLPRSMRGRRRCGGHRRPNRPRPRGRGSWSSGRPRFPPNVTRALPPRSRRASIPDRPDARIKPATSSACSPSASMRRAPAGSQGQSRLGHESPDQVEPVPPPSRAMRGSDQPEGQQGLGLARRNVRGIGDHEVEVLPGR